MGDMVNIYDVPQPIVMGEKLLILRSFGCHAPKVEVGRRV
jgi:hypothetical protein